MEDEKFLYRAQSCFYGGVPLNISLLFDTYFQKFHPSNKSSNPWRSFYEKNKELLVNFSELTNNIVFSRKFPMFLGIAETSQLVEILKSTKDGKLVYWCHDSYDVMRKITFNSERNYYKLLPAWLFKESLKKSIILVIDSSEEAPALDYKILCEYFYTNHRLELLPDLAL
jgi:hypothetical protein